ncbi:hypothetical protein KIPB_013946, partial [Kipferlia bialata]
DELAAIQQAGFKARLRSVEKKIEAAKTTFSRAAQKLLFHLAVNSEFTVRLDSLSVAHGGQALPDTDKDGLPATLSEFATLMNTLLDISR